jgi:formylglycine-generating enzyme required for sulfatase activity
MKNRILLLLSLVGLLAPSRPSAAPVVSNVRAAQRRGTYLVDIYYNLSSAVSPLSVLVAVSADGGVNYNVPAFTFSGVVGAGVTPGTDLHIIWNAGADWGGKFTTACRVRVTADDGTSPPTPSGMAYIPAGAFQMGDPFNEGDSDELPRHNVWVSAFAMEKFVVTPELWLEVSTWAGAHGYSIYSGEWRDAGHPVVGITWYDAVAWCNARSQMEELTPCYYTDSSQTNLLRSSTSCFDITSACVKWTANGYRLPTEAEWEKAARGGLQGKRYPWGDSIDGSEANYLNSGDPFETGTTPIGYYNGRQTPPGADMGNGFGLYDMAGNVWEFCWDWYDPVFYARADANNDPHGPELGIRRVARGGGWYDATPSLRCANRSNPLPSSYYITRNYDIGFRCVRNY